MLKLTNVAVRDVCDRDGRKLGRLIEPHDGTESGVIAAAQRVSDRMFVEYSDASNIESRLCATDASGKPKGRCHQTSFTSLKSGRTKLLISGV